MTHPPGYLRRIVGQAIVAQAHRNINGVSFMELALIAKDHEGTVIQRAGALAKVCNIPVKQAVEELLNERSP